MRLYFTGASKFLSPQPNSRLSLGGYISSTPIPNGMLNGIFGSFSDYQAVKGGKETRGFVLRNETGGVIASSYIYYENISVEPISNFRIAVVAVQQDDCGDLFIEKINNISATPLNATFIDAKGEDNKIAIPPIPIDGFVGVWIERTINTFAFNKSNECDRLYSLYKVESSQQVESIETVADVAGSLNQKYWFLNTIDNRFFIWYATSPASTQPVIPGREGIKVLIDENDTDILIAEKTSLQLNSLLEDRGILVSSHDNNLITITHLPFGPSIQSKDVDTSFTFSLINEGTSNEREGEETINLFIEY